MVEILGRYPGHREGFVARQARGLAEVVRLRICVSMTCSLPSPAPDKYRLFGAVLGTVGPCQHHGATRISHQADIEQVEGIAHRSRVEHIVNGERFVIAGFGIEAGPRPRRHCHLRPLFQRRAVLVHMPRGDHAEIGRGPCKAIGDFVLTAQAVSRLRVTPVCERPLSPCEITATSHRPWCSATTAWPTMMMNEQPPTEVPSI